MQRENPTRQLAVAHTHTHTHTHTQCKRMATRVVQAPSLDFELKSGAGNEETVAPCQCRDNGNENQRLVSNEWTVANAQRCHRTRWCGMSVRCQAINKGSSVVHSTTCGTNTAYVINGFDSPRPRIVPARDLRNEHTGEIRLPSQHYGDLYTAHTLAFIRKSTTLVCQVSNPVLTDGMTICEQQTRV